MFTPDITFAGFVNRRWATVIQPLLRSMESTPPQRDPVVAAQLSRTFAIRRLLTRILRLAMRGFASAYGNNNVIQGNLVGEGDTEDRGFTYAPGPVYRNRYSP